MDIKAVVLSSIAIVGSGALLWTGFSSASGERGERQEEGTDDSYRDHDEVRNLQQQGDILSLEQILQNARQHREGRVLETELARERDDYVYEVEMVDKDGVVWEMKFDARSGELLETERED
jgi:uncharacterized membrane protein YkoI